MTLLLRIDISPDDDRPRAHSSDPLTLDEPLQKAETAGCHTQIAVHAKLFHLEKPLCALSATHESREVVFCDAERRRRILGLASFDRRGTALQIDIPRAFR